MKFKTFLFLLLCILSIDIGIAIDIDNPITNSYSLNSAGATYRLLNDTLSENTTFIVAANGFTFDGMGNIISYANTSKGYAFSNTGGYDNFTIKNVTINEVGTNSSSHGIYLNIGINNSTIDNVTINTNNTDSNAIFSRSVSNSLIENCIVNTNGTIAYGIYLRDSTGNMFESNSVLSTSANALYVTLSSHSNNIYNNTFDSVSSSGCYLSASNNNVFWNNSISSISTYALNLQTITGLIATNNTITSDNKAIIFYDSDDNNFENGSITSASASETYYMRLSTGNKIRNTNFTDSRKIYFRETTAEFNYTDQAVGNTFVDTTISVALKTLDRFVLGWNQTSIRFNDTSNSNLIATYNITGLTASSNHTVKNGTTTRTIASDSNGYLTFDAYLQGSTDNGIQIILASTLIPSFTYTSANTTSHENEIDTFTANSSQTVNVLWLINGAELQTNISVTSFLYSNSTALNGTHNITAIISNANGSTQYSWSQLKLLNLFDMYVINETQTLVWFETSNYTAGLQGFNFTWENRIGTTGNTSTLYYQNSTLITSNSTYVDENVTLIPGFLIPEGTYYIEETATTTIETFIVAAGAFTAVVVAGAAVVSRRVRRGIRSGFWNRRIWRK